MFPRVVHFQTKNWVDTAYYINSTDSVNNIQKVDQIKDLGILYDSHLTFKDHIQKKLIKHILWLDSHNGLPTFAFYTHFRTHFRTLFIRILYERTFAFYIPQSHKLL